MVSPQHPPGVSPNLPEVSHPTPLATGCPHPLWLSQIPLWVSPSPLSMSPTPLLVSPSRLWLSPATPLDTPSPLLSRAVPRCPQVSPCHLEAVLKAAVLLQQQRVVDDNLGGGDAQVQDALVDSPGGLGTETGDTGTETGGQECQSCLEHTPDMGRPKRTWGDRDVPGGVRHMDVPHTNPTSPSVP